MNGKLYIGQTGEDNVEKRYKNGLNYLRCPYFYNAIQKYGWDNFEHIVLFNNLSKDVADIVETALIDKYDTTNRDFGYNLQSGGTNGKPNDVTRLKMSENHADVSGENNPMYHKNHSLETRLKMSKNRPSYIGKNNPNYGKKCSEYSKEMTRKKNSKPIVQLTKDGEYIRKWNSASEAGRNLDIRQSAISKVCNGDKYCHTAGGYKWVYEGEYLT